MAVTIVAARRSGEGERLPAGAIVHLDVLDRAAAAQLVGTGRLNALYSRSRGHPLFLTELAQQPTGAELPASLVESVSARCDELGAPGLTLRTAALIGSELDVDLLATVLGRPLVELLNDVEQAVAKQFLIEQDGRLAFRHELVREALAASATAGRAALLHRQVGRVLAARQDSDPMLVARHARLGGDLELAAAALRDASARAAERFDHAAAEALLDDALEACTPTRRPGSRGPASAPGAASTPRLCATSSVPLRPDRLGWKSARGRPTSAAVSLRPRSSRPTAPWRRRTPRRGLVAWP